MPPTTHIADRFAHSRDGAPVAILDRDGTIVVDRGYLSDPAGLTFEPGAAEGILWLHEHGYRLVVITNQSGVGRGFFPMDRVEAMNARLRAMVEEIGARLAGIYVCPHAPSDGCDCRKPAQRLMQQAAAELGFAPASSVVIGDKQSDVDFGRRAGAKTVLIAGSDAVRQDAVRQDAADLITPDLLTAARALTS